MIGWDVSDDFSVHVVATPADGIAEVGDASGG